MALLGPLVLFGIVLRGSWVYRCYYLRLCILVSCGGFGSFVSFLSSLYINQVDQKKKQVVMFVGMMIAVYTKYIFTFHKQ